MWCVGRIGLVFVVSADENVDAHQDVGVAMYRAFNYIMKRESAVKALSFLTDVRLSADVINQCNVELSLFSILISTKALHFGMKNSEYVNKKLTEQLANQSSPENGH